MGILTWGTAPTSRDDNWESLVISEINENDPIPYISNIIGDTCPPNYSHQITIYGQNFRPNSTVNIPGVSNLSATIISPTEIIAEFTSGAIIGAFDIEVKNGEKSSLLWGQSNKLNIINPTGGTLPLLDTWIDCRINGSPDAMIGEISKDNNSTWTRGIFGYSLTSLASLASNWGYFFKLADYSFDMNLPLAVTLITYSSTLSSNIRWGLYMKNDSPSSTQGLSQIMNISTQFSYSCAATTTSRNYNYAKFEGPPFPLNTYVKTILKADYVGIFTCDPDTFESITRVKEFFIDQILVREFDSAYRLSGFTEFEPGLKIFPGGINLSNYSHLTAFKLSWV